MHARFALIATAALMSASAFAAEPVKPAQHQLSQQQPASAQVVLASADDVVRAPAASDQQASTPAKPRRIARVTTCRCGDVGSQPDSQQ